jgi:TrmH family RNA methyltransferase
MVHRISVDIPEVSFCRLRTQEGVCVKNILDSIRVIVIEPSGAGNVGSIARAMANFSLSRLVLVSPAPFDMNMARDFACNGAHLIDGVSVADSFDEAIKGAHCLVAATRRVGTKERCVSVRDGAMMILEQAVQGDIALVFGRERSGLLKEEKMRCHLLVNIDSAGGAQGSLNISHAAAVLFHEIFSAQKIAYEYSQTAIGPLLDAFDHMLSKTPDYGKSENLQQIFHSVLVRSRPTDDEIKKLTRCFGFIGAMFREKKDGN